MSKPTEPTAAELEACVDAIRIFLAYPIDKDLIPLKALEGMVDPGFDPDTPLASQKRGTILISLWGPYGFPSIELTAVTDLFTALMPLMQYCADTMSLAGTNPHCSEVPKELMESYQAYLAFEENIARSIEAPQDSGTWNAFKFLRLTANLALGRTIASDHERVAAAVTFLTAKKQKPRPLSNAWKGGIRIEHGDVDIVKKDYLFCILQPKCIGECYLLEFLLGSED